MNLYGDINKVEPQDDGTLKVYGIASAETMDSAGEVVTADAMKAALPDYMKFGAVREMHQASAAGTAISAEVDKDGRTLFAAHVIDPIAIKKVNHGVYKGFSIGGKVRKRDPLKKNVITEISLTEISLVDRPAHPEAIFDLYKVDKKESPNMADETVVSNETADKGDIKLLTPDPQTTIKNPPNPLDMPTQVSPAQTPPYPEPNTVEVVDMSAETSADAKKADLEVELAKAHRENDLLKMMLDKNEALAKIHQENDGLRKRISDLETMPAPSNVIVKGVAVSKAEEAGANDAQDELKKAEQNQDPDAILKLIHARKI